MGVPVSSEKTITVEHPKEPEGRACGGCHAFEEADTPAFTVATFFVHQERWRYKVMLCQSCRDQLKAGLASMSDHELKAMRGLATSVAAKENPTSTRLAACVLRLLREIAPEAS